MSGIEAHLPDGTILQFPEGTAPEVVQATVKKQLGIANPAQPEPAPFNVLPLREDREGNVHFDINSGLTGALLRAITAPADAYAGKFDPLSPEGQRRAFETALTISPGGVGAAAGEKALPGAMMALRRASVKPPTAAELKSAAKAGYTAARNTGAEYPGQGVASAMGDLKRDMETEGFLAEIAPKTFAILNKLQNAPRGSVVTISSLDAARKALNRIPPNPLDNTEHEAARRVIRGIDDLIEGFGGNGGRGGGAGGNAGLGASPDAAGGGVDGGGGTTGAVRPLVPARATASADGAGSGGGVALDPAQVEAARLIREARGNAAAKFRSDRITRAENAAELGAAAANSGQNLGNALRQRVRSILLSDKQSRGFSPKELAAMRQVVEGTATGNTLRYVSNLLGGGGGIGQTGITALGATMGGAIDGGTGAAIGLTIPPVLGAMTRRLYNSGVGRQVGKLDKLIRQRSPLYDQRLSASPFVPITRDQILRSLLLADLPPAVGGLLDTRQKR